MSSEPKFHLDEITEAPPNGEAPIVVEIVARRTKDVPSEVRRYELHPANRLNLLGVFREIYFHHDPTFGFRNYECGRGICSTCNVHFDGRVRKACKIPIPPGSHITIAPQNPERQLRDVACAIGDEAPDDD